MSVVSLLCCMGLGICTALMLQRSWTVIWNTSAKSAATLSAQVYCIAQKLKGETKNHSKFTKSCTFLRSLHISQTTASIMETSMAGNWWIGWSLVIVVCMCSVFNSIFHINIPAVWVYQYMVPISPSWNHKTSLGEFSLIGDPYVTCRRRLYDDLTWQREQICSFCLLVGSGLSCWVNQKQQDYVSARRRFAAFLSSFVITSRSDANCWIVVFCYFYTVLPLWRLSSVSILNYHKRSRVSWDNYVWFQFLVMVTVTKACVWHLQTPSIFPFRWFYLCALLA